MPRLSAFFRSPLASYLAVFCLVLKVMWGIWDCKDIDWGDTICYYSNACETFERGRVNIVWSPLFAMFGSLVLRISSDPYFYCIATRVFCVLALAALTLAIARRLLPPAFAWLVAVWWCVLPINFDTLYQVHLFGAIPVLLSWLLLLWRPGDRWQRGVVLSLLVGAGILIRNELMAYALMLGIGFACYEIGSLIREKVCSRDLLLFRMKPYVVPLLVVAALVGGVYARSVIRYPGLSHVFRHRHTNNVGQVFAFGFQQRRPGVWNKSAWLDYGELMKRYFGAEEVTMTEACIANPQAMSEHLLWNASLIPSGLQLMLFNRIGGHLSPDYIVPNEDPFGAATMSGAVLLCLALGAMFAWRERSFMADWSKPRRWALFAMFAYVPVAVFVMLMQRPRTAYVFPLGIEIMTAVAFSLWLVMRGARIERWAASALPALLLLAVIAAPSFYPSHNDGRPLLSYVRLLQPFKWIIAFNEANVIVPRFPHEISRYIYGMSVLPYEYRFTAQAEHPELMAVHSDYLKCLDSQNIKDAFFDEPTGMGPGPCRSAIAKSPAWKLVALRKLPDRTLALYTRSRLYMEPTAP